MTVQYVREFVEQVIAKAGIKSLPVDLGAVAKIQRVLNVDHRSMGDIRGMTERVKGGFNITLNSDFPYMERFTLAHELAHTMLTPESWTSEGIHRRTRAKGDSLERLCDDIAAELLMPTKWAQPAVRSGRIGTTNLIRFARRFDASLHSGAIRYAELSMQKLAVSLWRIENGSIHAEWEIGDGDLCSHIRVLFDRRSDSLPRPVAHAYHCQHPVVEMLPLVDDGNSMLMEVNHIGRKRASPVMIVARRTYPDTEIGFLQSTLHKKCRQQEAAA